MSEEWSRNEPKHPSVSSPKVMHSSLPRSARPTATRLPFSSSPRMSVPLIAIQRLKDRPSDQVARGRVVAPVHRA